MESVLLETARMLKGGRLFKLQVQESTEIEGGRDPSDTWLGASGSKQQAFDMADRSGFELRYDVGERLADYWLWMSTTETDLTKSKRHLGAGLIIQ